MTDQGRTLAGAAIVAIAASMFGMLGPLTRFSYDTGLDPLAFIGWRSVLGGAAASGAVAWRLSRTAGSVSIGFDRRSTLALLLASTCGFVVNVGLFSAFERLPIAVALLAFYTYPALVAAAAVALGHEAMDRYRAVALGLALAGMVAVVAGGSGGLGRDGAVDGGGVLLALMAAAGQTVFVTVSRAGYRSIPTDVALTAMLAFIGVAGSLAAITFAGGAALALPFQRLDALGLLVFAGLFTAAIPTLLLLNGIRRVGAMRAGILMLLEPVVGVLLAALLLAEPLGPVQLAGGLAILAAAVILESGALRLRSRLPRPRSRGAVVEVEADISPHV
jgi:drug/metabolite transporter (DMT)-like permease